MISVPCGTGDIPYRYDIRYADDIRFAYEGTDIITSVASNKVLPEGQVLISCCDEGAIYHTVRQHGISCGVAVYH